MNQVSNNDDAKWAPPPKKKDNKVDGWANQADASSSRANAGDKKIGEMIPATELREPCQICGYNNHATKECRRYYCEIYDCNTHTTYDYVNCLP